MPLCALHNELVRSGVQILYYTYNGIMQAIMDGLSGAGRQMVAPMALFFLTAEKQLVPLAIQLQQRIGEQNPVFLPTDPPNIWYIKSF